MNKEFSIFDRETVKQAIEQADYQELPVMDHLAIIVEASEKHQKSMLYVLNCLIKENYEDYSKRSLFVLLKLVCFFIRENDLNAKDIPARITMDWCDDQVRKVLFKDTTIHGVN